MLVIGTDIIDTPVLSLQTGRELARTTQAIINPHNLSILAYEVDGSHLDSHPSYLRIEDVREFSRIGMIVDSSDEFLETDDIVKFKELYELQFELIGKPVLDEKRNKVGRTIDYTIEVESFVIQQLIVKRPILQRFNDSELTIHRSQVIEVTDDAIVIKAKGSIKQPLKSAAKSYVNPFRQTPQAEAAHSSRK